MLLIFGLSLDRSSILHDTEAEGGVWYVGPQRFIQLFEGYLGLGANVPNVDYLRVEQFRQLLQADLAQHPNVFYAASFQADPFATAGELLSRRDELMLAGWDFQPVGNLPARLQAMVRLRQLESTTLPPGFADRFDAVYRALLLRKHPIHAIQVQEPSVLITPAWHRMFDRLLQMGVSVTFGTPVAPQASAQTDLGRFQRIIQASGKAEKIPLQGDGSLILVHGKRDTDLAAFAASWLRKHPDQKPCLLLSGTARTLDDALVREGLPSLGLQTVSLARPALQVLKLAPVFLWEPLDPYKTLEFVSLALKPLDEELASRIAQQMAQTPGVFSESWSQMLGQYFAELEAEGKPVQPIREPYRFWFERRRFDSNSTAPKAEALAIFSRVSDWAKQLLRSGEGGISLNILSAQAGRIVELLEALPETTLTRLQLERIVRTIFEPAPLQLRPQEAGSLQTLQAPGATIRPVDALLWWNFSQSEPDYFFSRWSKSERDWLEAIGITLESPALQNQLLVWQRKLPVLQSRHRLILVEPELVEGKQMQAHPLLGALEAGFSNLDAIRFDIDTETGSILSELQPTPVYELLPLQKPGAPPVFIQVPARAKMEVRETESFSSLETLLYYPYQWVFRYKLQLRKSAILGIVDERALAGNLAHRFFELLLREKELLNWSSSAIEGFIDAQAPELLRQEGAVLLLYGREPERVKLIRNIKRAALSLVDVLQRNGWKVKATEESLEGAFEDRALKARADLILERPGELAVVDLKWGGATYRQGLIKNEEDLQLVLYTYLLKQPGAAVHSAYFILEQGKMIARNQLGFRDVQPIQPGVDHEEVHQRILNRVRKTLTWRIEQLSGGRIEVRSSRNFKALEAQYREEAVDMFGLLEMRNEDARFDEYKTLVNLL